jgi:hypothetical protein
MGQKAMYKKRIAFDLDIQNPIERAIWEAFEEDRQRLSPVPHEKLDKTVMMRSILADRYADAVEAANA